VGNVLYKGQLSETRNQHDTVILTDLKKTPIIPCSERPY